jgi:hypothetical protein
MQIAAVISAELGANLDVNTKSDGLDVTFEFKSAISE